MDRFGLYRDRIKAKNKSNNIRQADFITNSLSSTVVLNVKEDKTLNAVLTRTHKEGVSETLLFTEVLEEPSKINVGDYIEHKNKTYMAMLEYDHPLKEHYYKYNLIECNVNIGFNGIQQKAAYISSLRSYVEQSTSARRQRDMSLALEDYKPVVITKDIPQIKYGTRFLLGTEAFKVIGIDRLGNQGVLYLSVEAVPKNQLEDDLEAGMAYDPRDPKETYLEKENYVKSGRSYSLLTVDGYVEFSTEVDIIKRTKTEVQFIAPFAQTELRAKYKQLDGTIAEKIWRVI